MRIFDDPIQPDPEMMLSIERFYEEFNDILEFIITNKKSPEAKIKAEECISLCRTAISTFTYQKDLEAVRKIVRHFNKFCDIIVDVGSFKLAQEFDILTYGPGAEDKNQVQDEKARLSEEFLLKLYVEGPTYVIKPQKYDKAALFQGMEEMINFYRNRYGWKGSDITEKKESNGQ